MSEETLRVNFEDNASQPAAAAAEAIEKLDAALSSLDGKEADVNTEGIGRAQQAFTRLQGAAKSSVSTAADVLDRLKAAGGAAGDRLSAAFDAARGRAAALAAQLKDTAGEADKVKPKAFNFFEDSGAFKRISELTGKVLGPEAAEKLNSVAEKVTAKLGTGGRALIEGGTMLASGAAAAAAAGAVLAAAATAVYVKLLAAGAELAIKATAARESFVNPLARVLKDTGAAQEAYASAIRVAVDLSLDKEDTLQRAKALAGVGFRGAEIEVVLRAVADVREGIGDEAANAVQGVLQKLKSGKKFNEETINALTEAGMNSDLVLKKLAEKLGTSVDDVKLKLKSGAVDVAKGIQAIIASANDAYGGAASNKAGGVPELLQSLRTQVESFFDKVDLSPVKELLSNLKQILSGPEGEKLQQAVNNLFGTTFKVLFGAFQGKEGNERLIRFITALTDAMNGGAKIMEAAGPQIIEIIDRLSRIGQDAPGGDSAGSWLVTIANALQAIQSPGAYVLGLLQEVAGLNVGAALYDVGADMINGLVNGLLSLGPRVVDTLTGIVGAAVAAAKKRLDSNSPSRVMMELGADTGEGMALGVQSKIARVKDAGQTLVGAVLSGAASNDNGSGAVSPSGAAGGGAVNVTINVNVGPDGITREQAREAGEQAFEAFYQQWRRGFARFARDESRSRGAA